MGVATITPGRKGVISGGGYDNTWEEGVVSGGGYNNTWEEGGS